MSDASIGPTPPARGVHGGTGPVRQPAPGEAVHPLRLHGDESPVLLPGFQQFDRLELESLMLHAYAQFIVEPKTGVVSIKIIDAATNEVIREIPPDVVLRYAEELESYLAARQRSGL